MIPNNQNIIPISGERKTRLPRPMDLWRRAQAQDCPHMRIQNAYHPAYQSSITPVTQAYRDRLPEGVMLPSATVSLSNMLRVEEMSDNELNKYVPKDRPYHPDVGGSPFVPGSARPAPPVVAQSAIKAAGEFIALARIAELDVDAYKKFFRKMWDLPENFDPEDYSPTVKPDRSKPWLRANKAQNYEIITNPTQQSMITVKLGNATSVVLEQKLDIDWDLIRVHIRQIASRVFFNEPGRLEELKKNDVTLYFQLRWENFEVEPPENQRAMYYCDPPVLKMSQADKAALTYTIQKPNEAPQPLSGLIAQALPNEVLSEMRAEKEMSIIRIHDKPRSIARALDELEGPEEYGPITVFSAKKEIVTKPVQLRSVIRSALRHWMLTSSENIKLATQISADFHYFYFDRAMTTVEEKLDWNFLDKSFVAWSKYRSDLSNPRIGDELRSLFFRSTYKIGKYSLMSMSSLLRKAKIKNDHTFEDLWKESYRQTRVAFSRLTIADFVKGITDPKKLDIQNLRSVAFDKIASKYADKYTAKACYYIAQYKNGSPEDKTNRDKAIYYQMKSKLYPQMGPSSRPWKIADILVNAMDSYVRKRRRKKEWWESARSVKDPPATLCTKFDAACGTRFVEFYSASQKAADETMRDVDTYFDSDEKYYARWDEYPAFKKRTKKIQKQWDCAIWADTPDVILVEDEGNVVSQNITLTSSQLPLPNVPERTSDAIDLISDDEEPPPPKAPDKPKTTMSLDLDAFHDIYNSEQSEYEMGVTLDDFLSSKGTSAHMPTLLTIANNAGFYFTELERNDLNEMEEFWAENGDAVKIQSRVAWAEERMQASGQAQDDEIVI
jgi:hypothetical protein